MFKNPSVLSPRRSQSFGTACVSPLRNSAHSAVKSKDATISVKTAVPNAPTSEWIKFVPFVSFVLDVSCLNQHRGITNGTNSTNAREVSLLIRNSIVSEVLKNPTASLFKYLTIQ